MCFPCLYCLAECTQRCEIYCSERQIALSFLKNRFHTFSLSLSSYFASTLPVPLHVPSQRKNKENFQNRSYHLIIDERSKNRSKSIIYEGNDRILLSESNLSSGFPVASQHLPSPDPFPLHLSLVCPLPCVRKYCVL